ncbi:GTPase Era [Woeseia oceani]|uniref:GTPase Era n=1 Tax=Woeseia oceani TaxID=1548547 RepID=A0A193LF73_9GAMM|nr:GTPase Era [Woeseia oceani]ANO51118.1 GTPase Era [Woeseia oceani]
MNKQEHRCGFVAVVGRPNVGKSTLINAIIGRKVSIVSPKPQTTRHRILAVHNERDSQTVFVDTPGLHLNANKAMNRMMNRTAANALLDADLVLLVCEADRWTTEDDAVLARVRESGKPTMVLLNKIDRIKQKEELLGLIAAMSERHQFLEILPLSAKNGENLDRLLSLLPERLPVSPPLFPDDMVSDRDDMFRAAELIREKLTWELRHELPYGLTVQIERFDDEAEGISMHAVIWVERDSQKGIVVGKGGALLKKIGTQARIELKRHYRRPVHLEMWVKVRDNWADSDKDLAQLGYDVP